MLQIFRTLAEAVRALGPFNLSREKAYFLAVGKLDDNPRVRQMLRHLDILNGKAAALLTHISLMIAVTAFIFYFMYEGRAFDVFGWIILAEMVAYIALTIPALVPLFVTNFFSLKGDLGTEDNSIRFYVRRRNSFYIAYFGCIILTIAFGITLTWKVIADFLLSQPVLGG